MKKFDARYSKILLILLGVLAAIAIGFQSNAVGFDSESQLSDPDRDAIEHSAPIFDPTGKLHIKLLSLLK
ncbi:MAG: hypothetical protein ABJF04_21290 [Reichenbachiella sp.]|uniref:hypothetical protein n=1 Tax=Reichenbachiella sp. TaxID=2184521 RepID=UPI003264337B